MQRGQTPRHVLALWGIEGKRLESLLTNPHPVTGLFAGLTNPEAIDRPIRCVQICLAPRHGKSELISRQLPAWMFGQNPDMPIIATSYGADLAQRMNRDCQRIIDSQKYREVFDGVALNASVVRSSIRGGWLRNSDVFEIVDRKGVYRSAGIGGGITGMGAACFDGETRVSTPKGLVSIKEIVDRGVGSRVWAYDHANKKITSCRVIAVQRKRAARLCLIRTSEGHELKCTPEHLVWQREHGFRQAARLRQGHRLLGIEESGHQTGELWGLRDEDRELQRSVFPMLPSQKAGYGDIGVLPLRRDVCPSNVRVPQVLKGEKNSSLLQPGVQEPGTQQQKTRHVRRLWLRDPRARKPLVFCWVQGEGRFPDELRPSVYKAPAISPDARPKAMRNLPENLGRKDHARSPYRRGQEQSGYWQSDNLVRDLPYSGPYEKDFRLESSEEYSTEPQWVYDIQVEGCGNLFAEGILCSNCAIIDDPFKSRKTAESPQERKNVIDWYNSTLYTRLEKNAMQVLINTRWHESDLSGQTMQKAFADPTADQWFCLVLPAILDCEPGPGDPRRPGEALWPNKYSIDRLKQIRATIGAYEFEALYQQRPAPPEGGIIKDGWYQYFDAWPTDVVKWAMSVDLSFADRGDFSAFTVWAERGADRFCFDLAHGRMSFTEQIRTFEMLCQKYPQIRAKYVEQAANGAALIDTLKRKIQGIIPVKPIGSKTLRVDAVAPLFEAGNVWFPSKKLASWPDTIINEFRNFPNGAHDDCVDSVSQYLQRTCGKPDYLSGTTAMGSTRSSRWHSGPASPL
ncbi:hypothetical protein Q3G72_033070 [Acer saccharum]|nr:hypothetical protein Q3G72_033070 [Acer saccharum]